MNRVARVWKWLTLCAQQSFFAISLLWKTMRGEEGQKILPLALLHPLHAILSLHLSNLSLEWQGKVTTHNTECGSPALITWALPVDRRAHCKHGASAERYRIKTDFSFPCYWELFCVLGDTGFRFYDEVPSSGSLRVISYIFSPFCFSLHLPNPKWASCWVDEGRDLLDFHAPPHWGMLPQSQPWMKFKSPAHWTCVEWIILWVWEFDGTFFPHLCLSAVMPEDPQLYGPEAVVPLCSMAAVRP